MDSGLDEAVELGSAKIETMRWDSKDSFTYQLRCSKERLWTTRMDEKAFVASRDLTPYA